MKTKEEIQNELNRLNAKIIETYEKINNHVEEEKFPMQFDEETGRPVQAMTKSTLTNLIQKEAVKILTEKAKGLKWALNNYEKASEFSALIKELNDNSIDVKDLNWIFGQEKEKTELNSLQN